MTLTDEYKKQVVAAMLSGRSTFGGSDKAYAKQFEINPSVYSRLKKGELEGLLKDFQWVNTGRSLNVTVEINPWKFVKTQVYNMIEEEVLFCKNYSKARILVDEPEIGKTVAAKKLSRTLKNCFLLDCSQAKTKKLFITRLARVIGVDSNGKMAEVMENIKYALKVLDRPIVILDEAGDVEYPVILLIKELWNATEGICGWYMMGSDGLRSKFDSGISSKKVGYRELFSRYSSKYSQLTPFQADQKKEFYRKLIEQVIGANTDNKKLTNRIVNKCLVHQDGNIGGLRRAESLLILMS